MEWVVFGFLAVTMGIVAYFHEPWLNEAQAWQIARCADISDILFKIPHFEGHPALWHLLMTIPAKCGVSYELGIKVISCLIGLAVGWILLFCSPFPRIMRILLPFHYFLFYQNAVISRPYGLMTLALLLMAITFEERREHPYRFVLSMILLCAVSGYGLVIAGGVAAVWFFEICSEKGWKIINLSFWKDRRIVALMTLFFCAVLILLQIWPEHNVYAFSIIKKNSALISTLYNFFAMLPDTTILSLLGCEEMPIYADFRGGKLWLGVLLGIVFLVALTLFSSKKSRYYLWIPYLSFVSFASVVYLTAHHLGIMLSFVIFWLWITWRDEDRAEWFWKLRKKIHLQEKDQKLIGGFGKFLGVILLVVPVFWTVMASVTEIKYDYFFSRSAAGFIKEHGLENATWVAEWGGQEGQPFNANVLYANTNPVALMPYFEHNFCINLNEGRDDLAYTVHLIATEAENQKALETVRQAGLPDVLLGDFNFTDVFGERVDSFTYVPVYDIHPYYVSIWKMMHVSTVSLQPVSIYVRADLLEQYGLQAIR